MSLISALPRLCSWTCSILAFLPLFTPELWCQFRTNERFFTQR
jgi:hypothetical protein